ncbi:MAG: HNH endonuclease [Candidatus Thiodiazotropha lotti]|nr:HNH endonuclease [Candidatus Thiodiazotropha lotti]
MSERETEDVINHIKKMLMVSECGNVLWKKDIQNHARGDIFGSIKETHGIRYRRGVIKFNELPMWFYAHRIAYVLHYGRWPKGNVDHVNGDGSDNSKHNLRDVCHSENQKNKRLSKKNKTGILGVYKSHNQLKFIAQIQTSGKKIHLGTFNNYLDAVCARKSAETKYNFHSNHGTEKAIYL